MNGRLKHFRLEGVAFPAKDPPAWASRVERWVQLDPFAFLLPEAFSRWSGNLPSRPARMLLSGFGASNLTDSAFALAGAVSPTKFVHTLPNIRASALLAVMGWRGPVLSLHRDPCTLAAALREGLRGREETWVWHVTERTADLFVLNVPEGPYQVLPRSGREVAREAGAAPEDARILDWFSRSGGVNFELSEQWVVRRG